MPMTTTTANTLRRIVTVRWKPSWDLAVVAGSWLLVVGALYAATVVVGQDVWGGMAYFALYAVVGATLTDRAVGGDLGGTALAAYVTLLVLPFVAVWARCIQRHFAMVHTIMGASWPRTIGVVFGATLALGLLVAAILALVGLRASVAGVVDPSGAS